MGKKDSAPLSQTQQEMDEMLPEPPDRQGEPPPESKSIDTQREKQEPFQEWYSDLVADEDAAVFEERHTGIKVRYVLEKDEILTCLKHSGFYKTTGLRAIIETIVLAIAFLIFFASFCVYTTVNNLVMSIVSLLLIAAIWLVPNIGMKKRSEELADGREIAMQIYPDEIQIGEGTRAWSIELDGTSRLAEFDGVIAIFTPEGRIAALPMRVIDPADLPDIQAMLVAGTRPKDED
jgi:hypothetical protein